jgi:hypothetical protein
MPTETMTMPLMSEDPWSRIQAEPDSWVGRRIEMQHSLAPFWALHPNGAPGIVIRELDTSAVPVELPRPRGIAVAVDRIDDSNSTLTMFLQTPPDRDVFQKLCLDIVSHAAEASNRHDASVRIFSRLRRWQSLLGLARGNEMTDQEVRGLLGELWFLTRILRPRLGLGGALAAWVAPQRHPQDFALPKGVFEIKSRLTGSRAEVSISSLEQLEQLHLPLCLVVVELAPSDQVDALSLNELCVQLLRDAELGGDAMLEAAHRALADRGYVASPKYDALTYRAAGSTTFTVANSFPRLLRNQTDPRITQVTYTLALTDLVEFHRDLEGMVAEACKPAEG